MRILPEEPKQTETPTPERRKLISLGGVIVIVVALVAVLAGTWYAEEVGNAFRLQAWNKGAPLAAANAYIEAFRADDRAAFAAAAPLFQIEGDSGQIIRVKVDQNPNAGFQPAINHKPTRVATKADMRFVITAKKACAQCDVPTESGGKTRLVLTRDAKGAWKVTESIAVQNPR